MMSFRFPHMDQWLLSSGSREFEGWTRHSSKRRRCDIVCLDTGISLAGIEYLAHTLNYKEWVSSRNCLLCVSTWYFGLFKTGWFRAMSAEQVTHEFKTWANAGFEFKPESETPRQHGHSKVWSWSSTGHPATEQTCTWPVSVWWGASTG